MINFLVALLVFTATAAHSTSGLVQNGTVLGETSMQDYFFSPVSLETKSNFAQKEITEKVRIPFKTQYAKNPNLDADVENVVQEGKDGEKRNIYTLTFWQGKQTDKTLKKTETTPPQDKVVEMGTRYSWKEITSEGKIYKYWKKVNVRATSYDANCKGCTGRTWAGTEVQLGTCAVDPKVIVMGSHFYVPGYGVCSALDIGGAIKGNKIDLGFPDVTKGFWSTRYVDIYLLDGEPKS